MPRDKPNEPGDAILNRAMPDASDDEREAARANLRRLARLLIRGHARLAREQADSAIRANDPTAVESGNTDHV